MNVADDIAAVVETGLDIRTRMILALGAVMILVLGGLGLVAWAENRGAVLERAKWQKIESKRINDTAELILKNGEYRAALVLEHQLNNVKVSADHETELETLRRDRALDRAAVDRAGGLRLPGTVCDSPAAGPQAPSAGGRDEASASTVRLPPAIESGLWGIADDADELSAQLRSCQAWIVSNGFYGLVPAKSPPLLDRMLSTKNQQTEAQRESN